MFRKGVVSVLVSVIAMTYSMVVLAAPGVAVGDLTISGRASSPDAAVTINGEPATSGRTLFSSGVIKTPEGLSAVLNLGKAGKIRLEPSSTFALSVDNDAASGELMAGNLTVINSTSPVAVKTAAGVVNVAAGESASSTAATPGKAPTAGGIGWGVWAAVIAGGVFATLIIANSTGNDGAKSASPIR